MTPPSRSASTPPTAAPQMNTARLHGSWDSWLLRRSSMSSRQQGLRRSPFESQPSGIDAWLGADGQVPEVPEVPEVPDVSDVANVSNVRAVPDAKKVVRIAGPKWDPDLLQQGRDAVLFL